MDLNSFQTSGNSPGRGPTHRDECCHVGLLGFGAVGAAVARRLTGPDPPPRLKLTHICDRRARDRRPRESEPLASLTWTDRFDDLLTSDIDILVEALPGGDPAVDYIRGALLSGKSVVTANKRVMAYQGSALLTLAERQGRQLRFEAAVGGAMPIVRVVGEGLAGDRITRIDAILNGTSNAVLSQMHETGCSLDEAVAEACARGYAEADPSVDLDGIDAAMKLSILCGLAFGLRIKPESVEVRSSARLGPADLNSARERGGTIRQVAHAAFDRARGSVTVWVAPMFVGAASLFARTAGPQNAAILACEQAGEITMSGQGAGGDALSVAMVGDVRTIARDRAALVPAPLLADPQEIRGLSEPSFAEAV